MSPVVAMLREHGRHAARDGVGIGVRELEFLGNGAGVVLHARDIEEGDLDLRLEIDIEQLQQFQFVLRRLRLETHEFAGELLNRPRDQRGGAEAAALGGESLRVQGARALVLGEGGHDERQATLGCQCAIGSRGLGHLAS